MSDLKQFFGAYFHQDWNLDASDPDEVVHLLINDGYTADELSNLAHTVENYASTKTDDAATENDIFKELGCYYTPSADGIGARAWLYHVAELLRHPSIA